MLYPTVVLVLQRELNLGYAELIALMLWGNILFGAAALPAGWFADKWSTVGMMVVYFLGTGGAAVLTGFARTPFEIALGLAAIGTFAAIYHPVGISWVVRNAVDRGKALGWNGSFGAIGLALGPIVAGAVSDWWSWRAAFILPGLFTIALGLALLFFWRSGRVADEVSPLASAQKIEVPGRSDMIRAFFILSLTMTCVGFIGQAFTVVLPKLFQERFGGTLSNTAIGGLVTVVFLLAAFAQPFGGWLADRYPMKRVYAISFVMQAPVLFAAATLQSWPLVVIVILLIFVSITASPSENKMLAHFTPSGWQGTAYGAKFVLTLGVSALAIPAISWVHGSYGDFFWLFIGLGVLATTGMVGATLLPGERVDIASAPAKSAAPAE
jgi:MFS family permease